MSVAGPSSQAHRSRIRDVDRWLLAAVALCLVTMAVHRLFALDIWWQIAAGRFIAAHGIPQIDPFSFAFPGHVWVEPRWLWCLGVYALYSTFGVNALILLKVSLLSVALGLLTAAGRDQPRWAAAFGAVIVLAASHERFMVRPELLSFVALSATLLAVRRFKTGGPARWIWFLPVMQVIWCSAHTLWVLGPVTLWIVVVAELGERILVDRGFLRSRADTMAPSRLRTLAAVAVVSSLSALANPYLLRGVLFPFGLFREIRSGHVFSETIAEFRSPFSTYFLATDYRTTALVAVVVVSVLGFVLNRHRTPISRLALWGAYLFLAIEAQRNVALFAWVAGFATMLNLGQWYRASEIRLVPWVARSIVALFVLVMIPAFAGNGFYRSQGSLKRFGFGVSEHRFPVRALAFVREQGLPAPVIHSLGDGGYAMFEGGEGSVYADGRLEVYGADALERVFRLTWTGEGLEEESDRTGASTVIVPNDIASRPLVFHLEQSQEWLPVYYDPLHLVYVRYPAAADPAIQALAVDWSSPRRHAVEAPSFHGSAPWLVRRGPDGYADERLGSLFAGVGNYSLALEHFERAHAADPGNDRVQLFLGLFREAQGRQAQATALLNGLPPSFLLDPQVHLLASAIDLWGSNPAKAVAHLRRARDLGAPEPEVSFRLARAALLANDEEVAEEALRSLEPAHSRDPELWNLMAVLEIKRGRAAEAGRLFERSLALDPDQDDVRARLEMLRRASPSANDGDGP